MGTLVVTFGKYPPLTHWVKVGQIVSEPTMYSAWTHWVIDPLPPVPPSSESSLPKTNTTGNNIPSPDLLPPNNSLLALVTEVSTHGVLANQNQGVRVTGAPTGPDCNMPHSDIPSTTTDVLPTNATESQWMKAKKTLTYFREVHEMGKLSDLILHWYQLKEALGFQETMSHPPI